MNKKHILILLAGGELSINLKPTGGIFMLNQAKLLSQNNFKVSVISTGLHSINHFFARKDYPEVEKLNNLTIYRKYTQHFFINRYTPFEYLKAIHWKLSHKLFKKYITIEGLPDIIHSHNILYSGFCADQIFKKYNIPYLITEHSSDYFNHYSLDFLKKVPELIKNTSGLFTVSKKNSITLKSKLNIAKVGVIPNIVSKEFEYFDRKGLKKDNRIFNFIIVANLIKIKNIFLALDSFRILLKTQKDVHLKIIGEGPEKNLIKQYINQNNLSKHVSLMGRLSQLKVKDEYYKSDCLIVTSHYETFCNVIIEAMMCGLKVISTDVGIANEVINNNNGIVIDKDSVSLKNAMNRILELKNKHERYHIHQQIKKDFSQKNLMTQLLEHYEKI